MIDKTDLIREYEANRLTSRPKNLTLPGREVRLEVLNEVK